MEKPAFLVLGGPFSKNICAKAQPALKLSMRPIDRPKKTAVNDLKVGMFVQLPGNWIKHSFVRSKFLIKDNTQISRIVNSGIRVVVVDPLKSLVSLETRKKPNYIKKTIPVPKPDKAWGPPLMPADYSDLSLIHI